MGMGQVTKPISHLRTPRMKVINLLLTLIGCDLVVFHYELRAALPNCPAKSQSKMLQRINKIPLLKSASHLDSQIQPLNTATQELLAWICVTMGSGLVIATDDLEIPGFPDGTQQLILAEPPATMKKSFEENLQQDGGKSMLLFHGTGFDVYRSICRNGFRASIDTTYGRGLFMSDLAFRQGLQSIAI